MSQVLMDFQKKIGAAADGSFGPGTLKAAQKYFHLSNEQAAHFFAQCAHESGGFNLFAENLNYSAQGLMKTFKKYFPNETIANQYARQPVKIASRCYASRMGNGDEASQDGWRHRGMGAIQLTGKTNQENFVNYVKDQSVKTNPEQIATKYAFESAKYFFDNNGIWSICNKVDDVTITAVTRKINGGTNGLAERMSLTKRYYSWLI